MYSRTATTADPDRTADPSRSPRLRASYPRAAAALALGFLAASVLACAPAIDAQLDEAQSLVAEGKPMAALPLLESVVRRRPEDAPANLLLGQVLIQLGRTQNAFAPLENALASERWAVPAGLLLASAHLGEGRPKIALESVDRVLATHPDQTAALRIRATAYLQSGSAEEALADARRILELDPEDSQAPVLAGTALTRLGRLDEAEATLVALETGSRGSDANQRHATACAALAAFVEVVRRDAGRAATLWSDCGERHPADTNILQGATTFFDQQGRPDKSLAAMERALEHAPNALGIRLALAHRLAAAGQAQQADRLLATDAERREAEPDSETSDATAGWQALASYRQVQGNADGAQQALDRAIAAARSDQLDGLRFQRGTLLVDLGQVDEAESLANQIDSVAARRLLEGRIALSQGQAQEAIVAFQESAEADPSQARTHYWVGVASQDLGQIDEAFQAWDRALALNPKATDSAFAAAQLSAALGQNARAVELLRGHRTQRATFLQPALLLEARSLMALGEDPAAAALLEGQLRRSPSPTALALLAESIRRTQGPRAAIARIQQGIDDGLDITAVESLPALQAFASLSVATGETERSLRLLEQTQTRYPEWTEPILIELRILATREDTSLAEERLLAAARERPDDGAIIGHLASWHHSHGQPDQALEEVTRARSLAPSDPSIAYLAAQIATAQGNPREAEAALRDTVALNPLHVGACNDLAWMLASDGRDLDLALQLAQRVVRLQPGGATLDTLGLTRLARGETDEAIRVLSEATARDPEQPGYRYRLGLALAQAGRTPEAREAFESALAMGPFPESEQAREQLAR